MKKSILVRLLFVLSFPLLAQINEDEIKKIQPKEYSLSYVKPLKIENTSLDFYLCFFLTTEWDYTYERKNIVSPIVVCNNRKFEIDSFINCNKNFNELEISIRKNDVIKTTNFFNSYYISNFFKQVNLYKVDDFLVFILDIDYDKNEEILYFGQVSPNTPQGLIIKKYIDKKWKTVFSQSYIGFYDWNESLFLEGKSNEDSFDNGWFTQKRFPYDFVEYKGKIGFRIIFYDQPKDWPTHYHAQFWSYNEELQEYEMLEEIWGAEEDTPPNGLIFEEARTDLFTKNEFEFSKLDSKLTEADLKDLDKAQLRLMRNAVYARHGRTFKSVDLQSLWECYTWYKKNPNYSDALLTDVDKYNIELIQKYESK